MEQFADRGENDLLKGANPKLMPLLLKGQKHLDKEEWAQAAKYYVSAWDHDPENNEILIIVSHLLVQLGVRDKAISLLERALEVNGPTKEILGIMGQMSIDMAMHDIAEKLYRIYIETFPTDPNGYSSLASALGGQERFDESIALLQQIIPLFPDSVNLWNTLASHVTLRDGYRESIVFYEQAWQLNTRDYRVANNLARVYENLGDFEAAVKWGERSTKLSRDDAEPMLGLGVAYLTLGELKKGWRCYQSRLDKRRKGQVVHYTHKLPNWDGRSLKNKSVFVVSEQGVGDEILFGLALPRIYEQAKKLYIGCDKRLITVFQRTFPDAEIASAAALNRHGYMYRGYPEIENRLLNKEIKIDCAVEMGSIPRFHWGKLEHIPAFPDGYLKLDDERVALWKERLDAISDKPKIGIGWRSGLMTATRVRGYLQLDDFAPLFENKDVDFINVQYGDCAEDIAHVAKEFGVTLHEWDDLDLKDDFEGILAMMKNLDLIIVPATAPAMMGMAAGTPTWWLLRSRVWWSFGTDAVPFHPKGATIIAPVEEPWTHHMPGVAERLARAVSSANFTIK